jgi:hypothetical protein
MCLLSVANGGIATTISIHEHTTPMGITQGVPTGVVWSATTRRGYWQEWPRAFARQETRQACPSRESPPQEYQWWPPAMPHP